MAQLKGHAVIELTDVNTGEVERVEHDNLITNGATDILTALTTLATVTGNSGSNNAILPIEERLLCGIYLFDEALTESADNTQLPDIADAKLTGYAGNATSDGNDNKRGDFNSTESEALSNGYKFVWDFGTDDANGQIASLALTNYVAGYHGYNLDFIKMLTQPQSYTGNSYNNYKGLGSSIYYVNNVTSTYQLINMVSYEGDIVTTIDKISSSQIAVRRYRLPFRTVKIHDRINYLELIDETLISYTDSNQNSTQTLFVDGKDGYYYGIFASGTTSSTNFSISKINKTTLEYTPATVYTVNVRRDGDVFYLPTIGAIPGSYAYSSARAVIINGNIYTYYGLTNNAGTGTFGIIKFPLSNPVNWAKVPNTEKYITENSYENCFMLAEYNGNIFTSLCVIGTNDDFTATTSYNYRGYGAIVTNGKNMLLNYIEGSSSLNCYFIPLLPSLESINNLDSAVTKTSAKTMKITYTLTYAS